MSEEKDRLEYRAMVEEYTIERLKLEIEDLERQIQANGEMSESAHYHRYDKIVWPSGHVDMPNQFLAEWEDYESEVEEDEVYLGICQEVLREKMEKSSE